MDGKVLQVRFNDRGELLGVMKEIKIQSCEKDDEEIDTLKKLGYL